MNDLGSKQDVNDRDEQYQKETDQKLDEAREHQEGLNNAADEFEDMAPATLSDTAEDLNRAIDQLQNEAQANIENHDREVADGIDTERIEVSEPVRDAEDIDRQAAADLFSAASSAGDYSGNIEDAGGIRDHAADFLQDIADGNEQHQDLSNRDNDALVTESKATADSIRRF
jgi:hypothetical protein